MGGIPNVAQEGERPVLMLERQPPLPKADPMRLVAQEDNKDQEQALVPVMLYGEESVYGQKGEEPMWMRSIPVNYQEQKFNMDYNTLMFIAIQDVDGT